MKRNSCLPFRLTT